MTEIQSLARLLLGLSAICGAGALVATCLRLRSIVEFVLATYVISCAFVVALSVLLSPAHSLTTRSALVGSLGTMGAATLGWLLRGRPRPPSPRPAIASVRTALKDRLVGVLAVCIALAFAYSLALAFLTPVNDGDALAYHLARAGFWHQDGGIGYIDAAVDSRLNGNPPNAEIGMLFTILLAGSDRFVAIPQIAAYAALIACTIGLALQTGRDVREALFGALVLGSLPVVILQASTGLNDLVVAAFLTIATYFGLRDGPSALPLFALALTLALGTKFTALIAVPVVLVALFVGRARKDWVRVGAAAAVSIALGSLWYLVNLLESGDLDGGLAEDFGQRADSSVSASAVTFLRLLLDVADLSGTPGPFRYAYLVVGGGLILLATALRARSRSRVALALGGLLAVTPLLAHAIFGTLQEIVFRTWAALGRPPTPAFELGWNLNVIADPAVSWFGPLGVLLFGGAIGAIVLWQRRMVSALEVVFSVAPLALLAILAAVVVWDPYRGRLVIFAVALAASTWGLLLRSRPLAIGVVAIAATATISSMLNYQGKASGIGAALNVPNQFHVSVDSVWGASRAEVQARPRPGAPENTILRFVDESIPADTALAVAPRVNELLSPYFGSRFSRRVLLVRSGEAPPSSAEWLVVSPSIRVHRCPGSWLREVDPGAGWRIERRLGPDACLDGAASP